MNSPEDAGVSDRAAANPLSPQPTGGPSPIAARSIDLKPLLSLVVPLYNEEAAIAQFFRHVIPELERIPNIRFEILCVNDGSRDHTLECLVAASQADERVRVIDLTRNFGKEAALTAAIFEARGDLVVPFDADLQDPPDMIGKLVEKWREGYDVVLARRADRGADSLLKKWTALCFYRIHNDMADVAIPENVGDFRLFTRSVCDALKTLPESCRFMKGLFAWVGYRTAVVDYARAPRSAGTSKFSGWKLWNLALEGITSFSTLPLRVWTYLGLSIAFFALGRAAWLVVRTLLYGVDVPGYASLATAVLLLGGIQLIGIGVLGEYVGRIYLESKQRPLYLVRQRYERTAPHG
ncbi:glycosyltransferase family 2 protein [Massilia forsythiae]|uniref:Glycosyltransferase family 2 protein n=1 Tax=Massilia forsythiae TaxID=2728020 RepID=A0A7Z2ZTC1_9BURK|nr:glycosyltransferase family 2 protein [Massilia forsythiae]